MNIGARPIALTMGDPAGVGGEIALKAWTALKETGPAFFVIDRAARLAALARRIGVAAEIGSVNAPEEAADNFARRLPVLRVEADPAKDPADATITAIEQAAALALSGDAAAIVTNPINKKALLENGFAFPGHTEFLAALAERAGRPAAPGAPLMMLANAHLKAALVTIHEPLREAIASLTSEKIVAAGRALDAALRSDFGLEAPRIAVAGLNPHAGEGGALGREEIDIVAPAVETLREAGLDAFGPLPPDSMFHEDARAGYDAALCLYHDQALIPVKTLDFHGGVNATLGLPFIRTSPDHGTAYDIAGKGVARPDSLIAALRMAAAMAAARCSAARGAAAP